MKLRLLTSLSALSATALLLGLVPGSVAHAWVEENEFPLSVTFVETPSGLTLGPDGLLYVVSESDNSVSAFRPGVTDASGVTLVKTLKGPKTGMVKPKSVAFDSSARMFVVSGVGISIFAKDWAGGDQAPVRFVSNADAGLSEPAAIAFDSVNRMYVTSSAETRGGAGSVTVYDENWAVAGTAPVATLAGPNTGLDYPMGLAFDRFGVMYVANRQTITAYPLGWLGGDMIPQATLRGTATRLSRPMAIAFNDDGYMLVANRSGFPTGSIELFPPDWARGNSGRPTSENTSILTNGLPPTATVTGLGTQLNAPVGLAVTEDGRIFMGNQRSQTLTAYRPKLQIITTEGTTATVLSTRFVDYAAFASSGLAVSAIISTPKVCRFANGRPGRVELLNVGQCIVEVSQLGDDDWARAPVAKHIIQVNPSPQTITASMPASVSITTRSLVLSARASSGLPVFWLSSTPRICLATGPFGQRLKLKEPGTCVLSIHQPGNANWLAAPAVTVQTKVTRPR